VLTGSDQQAGPGRESMADGRRLRVGRERRHADGYGAAGRRPGHQRWLGGTMSRVQLLSVWVVMAVQPSDRTHREQDERRQRQMNDGHPKQRRAKKLISTYR